MLRRQRVAPVDMHLLLRRIAAVADLVRRPRLRVLACQILHLVHNAEGLLQVLCRIIRQKVEAHLVVGGPASSRRCAARAAALTVSRGVRRAGRVEDAVHTQRIALQDLVVLLERSEALLAEVVEVRSSQFSQHGAVTYLLRPDLLPDEVGMHGIGEHLDRQHDLRPVERSQTPNAKRQTPSGFDCPCACPEPIWAK